MSVWTVSGPQLEQAMRTGQVDAGLLQMAKEKAQMVRHALSEPLFSDVPRDTIRAAYSCFLRWAAAAAIVAEDWAMAREAWEEACQMDPSQTNRQILNLIRAASRKPPPNFQGCQVLREQVVPVLYAHVRQTIQIQREAAQRGERSFQFQASVAGCPLDFSHIDFGVAR